MISGMMKVAMYYRNSDVRLQEVPIPRADAGEIVIKVHASGICGSDVMEWYRIKKAPLVLGHEISGEITECGEGVNGLKVGDRVFASHHVPCLVCKYCLDDHTSVCDTLRSTNFFPGGFAQYVRVPKLNIDRGVFKLPDTVSYEQGVFVEPLACVYRGQVHARVRPGKTVAVLGSGLSGLLHIQMARANGAVRILATDVNAFRLDLAQKLGADAAIDARGDVPLEIRKHNGGLGADIVIVSTGARAAIEQAFRSVDRGGTILFFAPTDPGATVQMPFNELWKDEVTITTSYAGSPHDIGTAVELIRSGRVSVDGMVTHRLPLSGTQEGFQLTAGAGDSMKVIIEPWID